MQINECGNINRIKSSHRIYFYLCISGAIETENCGSHAINLMSIYHRNHLSFRSKSVHISTWSRLTSIKWTQQWFYQSYLVDLLFQHNRNLETSNISSFVWFKTNHSIYTNIKHIYKLNIGMEIEIYWMVIFSVWEFVLS